MTALYRERRANRFAHVFNGLRAARCSLPNALFDIEQFNSLHLARWHRPTTLAQKQQQHENQSPLPAHGEG